MNAQPVNLTYRVTVGAGKRLKLPRDLIRCVGEGEWVVSVTPAAAPSARHDGLVDYDDSDDLIWDPDAFLRGYGPEDEGLYDHLVAGNEP